MSAPRQTAGHSGRNLLVLLFAGFWALALAWMPSTPRLSEDHEVASLGPAETGHAHPATETPKFGTPEPEANFDGDAVLANAGPPFLRTDAALAQPRAARGGSAHRHDTARSARGPPIRA